VRERLPLAQPHRRGRPAGDRRKQRRQERAQRLRTCGEGRNTAPR
jgi:hypothetical protein